MAPVVVAQRSEPFFVGESGDENAHSRDLLYQKMADLRRSVWRENSQLWQWKREGTKDRLWTRDDGRETMDDGVKKERPCLG